MSSVSRRTVALATAWATPALIAGAAAPALASSTYDERIVACPAATSLTSNSAIIGAGPSRYGTGQQAGDAHISFTLNFPPALGNHGGLSAYALPLPFNADPYFVEASNLGGQLGFGWDVTGAAPFPITGDASGYTLAFDAYAYSQHYYYLYGHAPSMTVNFGITTPDGQPPQGCLSFQFQLGYGAGGTDPNGATDTRTSRPVPDESGSYCNYYFNGCFSASGTGTGISITSSPLYP